VIRDDAPEVREVPAAFAPAASLQEVVAWAEEGRRYREIVACLADGVRALRRERAMTQAQLADLIGSSQPRVSMLEAGDASVSLSLIVKTLVRLGVDRFELARLMGA
jgi:DNA-binding XRE family transcriptional regulator